MYQEVETPTKWESEKVEMHIHRRDWYNVTVLEKEVIDLSRHLLAIQLRINDHT